MSRFTRVSIAEASVVSAVAHAPKRYRKQLASDVKGIKLGTKADREVRKLVKAGAK